MTISTDGAHKTRVPANTSAANTAHSANTATRSMLDVQGRTLHVGDTVAVSAVLGFSDTPRMYIRVIGRILSVGPVGDEFFLAECFDPTLEPTIKPKDEDPAITGLLVCEYSIVLLTKADE